MTKRFFVVYAILKKLETDLSGDTMFKMRRLGVVVLAILMAVFLPSCRDEEFESATIEVLGQAEYAAAPTTPLEYVKCSSEDISLNSESDLDTTEVGMHSVELQLKKGRHNRKEIVEIAVKDTTSPEIKLINNKASIELGESFDPLQLVQSISDPVDGAFKVVTEKPDPKGTHVGEEVFYDQGWYLVSGDSDFTMPGEHKVTIEAEDKHGNKASESITIEVADPLDGVTLIPKTTVIEYSKKTTDPTKLVSCSVKDAKVSAKKLRPSKVGKASVEYTIEKGVSKHTEKMDFEVRDTKSPVITLESNKVEVDYKAVFDPYANVTSVIDKVDGALERVDKEPSKNGNGWYTVTGVVDTSEPSKYFLTAVACDRNGNRVEKEYGVVVNEPPVIAETPATTETPATPVTLSTVDNAKDYVLNTNTYKFHYPSCRDLKKMNVSNRQDVHMARDEIVGMGYSPCGHCHP